MECQRFLISCNKLFLVDKMRRYSFIFFWKPNNIVVLFCDGSFVILLLGSGKKTSPFPHWFLMMGAFRIWEDGCYDLKYMKCTSGYIRWGPKSKLSKSNNVDIKFLFLLPSHLHIVSCKFGFYWVVLLWICFSKAPFSQAC